MALRQLSLIVLLVLACATSAWAGVTGPQAVHQDAERLRAAGDMPGAVRLLERRVAAEPGDAGAWRLLAQTLYWMGQRARAEAAYASALARHPRDPGIRYDYARMLAETGDRKGARRLLEPLRDVPAWRAEAAALLGTIAYWEGDFAGAARLFDEALRADPSHAEAARLRREIRQASAPWLKLGGLFWRDDQPLDRGGAIVEAGRFLTPVTPVAARFDGRRYVPGDVPLRLANGALAQDGPVTMPFGEVELSHFAPAARLELKAIGGWLGRPSPAGHDWNGSLEAGLRLPQGLTPRARVERRPYLHTTASLERPVRVTERAAGLALHHPRGWMAEAEHSRRRFDDGNEGWTAYGWLLAPLVHRPGFQLHAGYAVSASDTAEPRFSAEGRYDPYHTPLDQRIHTAVAAARWAGPRGQSLDLNASAGVHARETAPFLTGDDAAPIGFGEREFQPWRLRAGATLPLTGSLALAAGGEVGRTSFYTWRTASASLTWRLH
jgi:Flp pilus assembly protein TadD